MVVMRNLSLEVVTGMTGPGATSEMAGQGVEVMIAGNKTKFPLNGPPQCDDGPRRQGGDW